MTAFNKLSPAQAERFAMLAEEAGEIVQNIGKILRHGLDNHHPDDPAVTNRTLLERELADFDAVKLLLIECSDLSAPTGDQVAAAYARKLHYAHHQPTASRSRPINTGAVEFLAAVMGEAD